MEPVRLLNRKSTKIWVNIHNETTKNVKNEIKCLAQANQLMPANANARQSGATKTHLKGRIRVWLRISNWDDHLHDPGFGPVKSGSLHCLRLQRPCWAGVGACPANIAVEVQPNWQR